MWMWRVVSARPMSRVRWEQQQQHLVQGSAKGNHHHGDAFQANNGVYGASAAGYAYGHTLSSSYSSTGSGSGVAMKREEEEMSVV